jgi:hypothetical protein
LKVESSVVLRWGIKKFRHGYCSEVRRFKSMAGGESIAL